MIVEEDDLWLGPPWFLVLVTLLLLTVVMWSLDALYPGIGTGLKWCIVIPVGALATYAVLLRLVSGDPRLWRDPARLDRLVRQHYPDWVARHEHDPSIGTKLRTLAWQSGSVAIAQQAGVVACAGIGYATLHKSMAIALPLMAIVGVVTGLLVRTMFSRP